MPRTFAAPLIAFLAALLLLNACASKIVQPVTYIVSVPKAAFYKYGPAQSNGPDLQLLKGRKLTLMNRSFGFSEVMTEDGTSGFIANEDIKPAPREPALAPVSSQNLPPSPTPWAKKPNRNNNSGSSQPSSSFNINDVPLPSADSTPAPNNPKFRY
jgi:hypothetical protein